MRTPAHQHNTVSLPFAGAAALVVSLLAVGIATGAGRPTPDERDAQGRRIVKQGGYIEKIEEGVDYGPRLPRIPPLSPEESRRAFRVEKGFRVELAAAEPLVRDPVDLAFDERGRLYVAELVTYPEAFDTAAGRVSRLEDRDGDGFFETSAVYADRLERPTGIACWKGGIFVASAPDLVRLEDRDGDGYAEHREVWLTGFDTSNPNALPNSLRIGLDGRLHGMSSTAGGKLRALHYERVTGRPGEPIECRGRDFSLELRSGELRLESGGAQFGMTYDEWGRKYESSNSSPIEQVLFEERYIGRNPFLAAPSARVSIHAGGSAVYRTSPVEPWRVVRTEMRVRGVFSGPIEGGGRPDGYFTSACGVTIAAGDAWPAGWRGDAFVCEGAGNLVHHMRLASRGILQSAARVEPGRDFLTSREVWFRPIQFADGPDGALYLADMYREVYEHPDAVPPSVRKHIDLNSGNDRGRVWRIVPAGFERRPAPRLDERSSEELVELLASDDGWHHQSARRLLLQRRDPAAVAPLESLAAGSSSPPARSRALWTLAALGALSPEALLPRLADPHPRVREHAVRLSEPFLGAAPDLRERLFALVADPDPGVRYQLAFTLGEIPGPRATAALAALARGDGADRWARLAVASSAAGRAGDLLERLARDEAWASSAASAPFAEQLSELAGRAALEEEVARVLRAVSGTASTHPTLGRAIAKGLGRGLAASGSPLRQSALSGDVGTLLADIVARARKRAADAGVTATERAAAIRSLALANGLSAVRDALVPLLAGGQPPIVQAAAIRALGRFDDPEVSRLLLDAWSGFSPRVRTEAAEVMFSRRSRIDALLDAIEEETVDPSQIDPRRARYLTAHPDPAVARRAAELLGARAERRADVVERYRSVLGEKGDPARGRELFRKTCTVCHRLEEHGYDLGLPLGSVKSRGPETILIAVLDPNRDVNPSYLDYTVVTRDARVLSGMIRAETATSITLERGEGLRDTVLRGEIETLESSGLSIMPEGLEEELGRDGLRDVIAYLMAVK